MRRQRGLRQGFTLIELLIVVVIIGILAAIAIPRFKDTKGKAYWAAMRSDLKNLATAEEAYYYDAQVYSNNVDSLNFHPSSGVTIDIKEATDAGWSATSTHPAAYPKICAIFMGNATPVAPATAQGVVACMN